MVNGAAELEPVDELMAQHLAAGLTYAQTAAACNCHLNTVYRRMLDAAFKARVTAIQRAAARQVYSRLVSRADDAVEVLHLIATGSEDEPTRIKAATSLLDHYLKQHEKVDLDERIRRLEAQSGGQDAG